MKPVFDDTIFKILNEKLRALENVLNSDVIFYFGEIYPSLEKIFRDYTEQLKKDNEFNRNQLSIILNTPGGSAETVEKLVNIVRHNYEIVNFIVPDSAMSAGTIFCMSGDKIYMDYSSSLGPIDPQVYNGTAWVPALGYLDKLNELIEKSRNNTLTTAELIILQGIDLAELRSYEMARNLTIALLKDWLVKYKFQNWSEHRTTNPGTPVTNDDKILRAEDIAKELSDNTKWHSHGRSIGIKMLTELRLEIEDYSNRAELREAILQFNDLICEYIIRMKNEAFFYSRTSMN